MRLIGKLFLILLITMSCFIDAKALGEPSTSFQVFIPARNQSNAGYSSMIVTATQDGTTFSIIDDGMDGDTDDSFSGTLSKGQSYVLLIKDGAVNDDSGGAGAKQDGDYFLVTSNKPVICGMATMGENQHDWIPSTGTNSKGQQFIVYNLPTFNSSQKRDVNVIAYENNTTVTVKKVSTSAKTTTGYTSVNMNTGTIVFQKTINIGEDLIYKYANGKQAFNDGETYLIETNKDVTVQYGSLYKNEAESAAYVPSSNGSGIGENFLFTVHMQGQRKQEIRINSWDNNNNINLEYYKNGSWLAVQSWTNVANQAHVDWVSLNGNIEYVFRVTCSAGKRVSVFGGNQIETGNSSTDDFATMLPSVSGSGSGKQFLAYLGSPGQENQVTDPFTNQVIGRATHLYLFAGLDSAVVTITDESTNGTLVNETFVIAPGRYADFYLDLAEWTAIYNGNGNPASGSQRPYVRVNSTKAITVLNTNYSDDWMTYFAGVGQADYTLQGSVTKPNGSTANCYDILDTAVIVNNIQFNTLTNNITNPTVTVVVPDEAIVLSAVFINNTTQTQVAGVVSTNTSTGTATVTFANLATLSPLHSYSIKTRVILAVNNFDGSLITDRTLITTTTTLSGTYSGASKTISKTSGILICNNIILQSNIVTPQANTWSVAWGDFNNDCYPDLAIANYDTDQPNVVYKNNGDGTFSEMNLPVFLNDTASSTVSTWGDYDNDGDLDLFVANNIGTGNFLYRNEGGTSFTRIYNDPIVNDLGYAHGATWVDYDNDGFLDMFTAEYFATRFNNLYHNNGDGTFTKNTTAAVTLDAGSSVAGVWGDYDNDGDQDLFVANTNNENNFLYRNNGNGNFTKIITGAIVNDGGQSVGASWGDYDNDGNLDLFVANAGNQNNFLYHNNGNGTFTKVTTGSIVNQGGHSHGSAWGDVNNDGWLDLFVANDQNSINFLYMNNGNGTFTAVDYRLSPFTTGGSNSFGSAFADYDNDGDLDLFVANHDNQQNQLIPNYHRSLANTNYFNVKLKGSNSNKSAIGSHIKAKATINGTSRWITREVAGLTGGGIGGQSDLRVHFGLGNATIIDSLVVTWPSGFTQVETNLPVNNGGCYTITELAGGVVSGKVYFDANKNGTQDGNEVGIPGVRINVVGKNKSVTTDENGDYEMVLNIGTYALQQISGANWSQSLPALNATLAVNVTQIGASYANNNFADTASCLNPDLMVELNTTALRVGFENVYAVTYRNTGTVAATNVVLNVNFGQHIIPISGNIDWDSQNGNVYTWNLGTVAMGESFTIFIADSVKTTAVIGNNLTVTANISSSETECNPADNQATDINPAVGAIDPNDITAYPGEYIRYDQEITYRIRFQNVGNSVANRVIVRSELPENLDVTTLTRGLISHASIFRIEDERTLVWDFQNINLIDSTANEQESHGYIWFKIKPVAGIKSGDKIQNFATIFFDNAQPIITNTATVTINGSQEVGKVSIFPNPVRNEAVNLKIEDTNFSADERIATVQIYDMRGVLLHIETGFDNKQVQLLPLDLVAGQYIIVAISNEGNKFIGKMMKQ